jgi:hypothetical protein
MPRQVLLERVVGFLCWGGPASPPVEFRRTAAAAMVEELSEGQRMTLGADKAYETADFV